MKRIGEAHSIWTGSIAPMAGIRLFPDFRILPAHVLRGIELRRLVDYPFLELDSLLHLLSPAKVSIPHAFELCKHVNTRWICRYLPNTHLVAWEPCFSRSSNFFRLFYSIDAIHLHISKGRLLISSGIYRRIRIKFVPLRRCQAFLFQHVGQLSLLNMTHIGALDA